MADAFDGWLDARPADEGPADGERCRARGSAPAGSSRCWDAAALRRSIGEKTPTGVRWRSKSCIVWTTRRARFELETKVLLQICHPNFPQLLSFGSCGERTYVVMELLKGYELPNKDRAVARFVRTVIAAVAELHRHGWLHRDIKPSNILLRANGEPVLSDFGLVCPLTAVEREKNALSVKEALHVGVGTKPYAAPEQFNGQRVGPQADVHALGMLIRECFRGKMPKCWHRIFLSSTNTNPEVRYQTVEKLGEAVGRRHWRGILVVAVVALALVLVGAFVWASVAETVQDSKTPMILPKDPNRY